MRLTRQNNTNNYVICYVLILNLQPKTKKSRIIITDEKYIFQKLRSTKSEVQTEKQALFYVIKITP